jgi:acrosin
MLKSKSRPAARRHPARAQLGLEQLETRLVPTVSVNLVNGQLQIFDGDNSAHTITLDQSGPANGLAETFLFVDGQRFFNGSSNLITAGIVINTGNDNATVNILAAVQPTTVTAGRGNDIVNLGKKGNVQAIQAPVSILHPGAAGGVALTVDDSNDPVSRAVTMGVSNGTGTITGLAPATISYGAADVTSVAVDGGSGGNGFTVADTVLNTRAGFLGTTLNSGGGDNGVHVLQTSGPLSVNTQQGGVFGDEVFVGNAHSLQGIHGLLTVSTSFSTFLELDGSADKTGQHATVTGNSVLNLAPVPIHFAAAPNSFIRVEIDPGSGNNTFDVQQTLPSTSLEFFRGSGNSTVNVGSPLHTLDTIQGKIHVLEGSGTTTVNVNDQGSTTPNQYLAGFDGNEVERRNLDGTVVGAVSIDSLDPAGQIAINLQGGSGGNTFNVKDTLVDVTTTLNTGLGNNIVNVQGTTGPLVINGQGGIDAVRVGSNGNAQGLAGALTITNLGGFTKLFVDDHLDHTGRVVTMNVAKGVGTIAGLSPATIAYNEANVSAVSVVGGDGGNSFDVENTASNRANPVTTISTGAGKNFVNVRRTAGALVVDGQGGADLVDVGLNGSVQGIKGALEVANSDAFSTLVVDDSADTVNRVVTMSLTGGIGSITGLAPATITYVGSEVNQVQILGGNGSNKYTINDTVSNSANPATILRGGTSNDTFNLLGSTGTLQIDGGGGSDVVNVGGTPTGAANVKGTLGLADTGGKIRLEVFDGGDTASRTVQVTDHSVLGLAGQINFNPTQLTSATLRLDAAADTVFVSSTPAGVPITIVDGGGDDVIHVGSAANTLDGIQGPLTVNGSISGFNTLIINDQGSTTPHVYTQTATTLSRSGAATISFFNVENLAVNKGPVLGGAPAAKGLKLTPGPNGSRLVTLTGQLTDANPAAKLALTVDWGDGSQPQSIKPGQSPFSLKHQYARKGAYTVRVIWTDLKTGQSNSQDLRLTVA